MATGLIGLPRPFVAGSGVALTYNVTFVSQNRDKAIQTVVDNKQEITDALQKEFDNSEAVTSFGDVSSLTVSNIVKTSEAGLPESLNAYNSGILVTVTLDEKVATTNIVGEILQPVTDSVMVSKVAELSDLSEGALNITTLDTPILG